MTRILQLNILVVFALLLFVPTVFAQDEIVPNQITVLYEDEEDNFTQLGLDAKKIKSVEHVSDSVDLITLKSSDDADGLIDQMAQKDGVAAVDHEAIARIQDVPNDSYYASQDYLKNINYENVEAGSNSVKVAVLDTGVEASHEDLVGRVETSGFNFVDNNSDTNDLHNHGTAIAGIIAAQTNNNLGIAGVAKSGDVKIVPFTVLNSRGEGRLSDIAAALESLVNRDDIKIINMSFSFNEHNNVIQSALNNLSAQNKLLIASSGNTETDQLLYPARYDTVFSVGAVTNDNRRCDESDWGAGSGSAYGDGLDLVAPGNKISSLRRMGAGKYGAYSGTSFSAPIFTGACALAMTNVTNITSKQLKTAISQTSLDIGEPGWDPYTGYGLLQLDRLVGFFQDESSGSTQSSDSDGVDIYRLYNSSNGEHLYTTNQEEVNAAVKNGWTSEGLGWVAPKEGKPVYRLYNSEQENHLYTMDENEVNTLTTQYGWTKDYGGVPVFYSGGDVAIYRLYNPSLRGLHHLTRDSNEYSLLPDYGWQQEDVALYALK